MAHGQFRWVFENLNGNISCQIRTQKSSFSFGLQNDIWAAAFSQLRETATPTRTRHETARRPVPCPEGQVLKR